MGRSDTCGGFGTSFESKRWLSLDPCGAFGIALSWGVHIYALAVIPLYGPFLSNSILSVILYCAFYIPSSLLAMTSLYMASTTDPGAVPLGARPLVTVRRAGSMCSASSSQADGSTGGDQTSNGNSSGPIAQQQQQAQAPPQQQRAIRRCHKCLDNYKPPRAHHDSVTGRCIVKFDHFCPWVNNSIGALNHKFFCLFLLYTSVTCCLSLLLMFMKVIQCGFVTDDEEQRPAASEQKQAMSSSTQGRESPDNMPLTEDGQRRFLTETYVYPDCADFYGSHYVLALFIASIVFLVFTCSMGCEQLEAIETGKSKIARMKMRVGQSGTEFSAVTEGFNEMFGGTSPRVQWHWFLPRPVQYPRGMKKVVLGYDWDPSKHTPYQEEDVSSSSNAGLNLSDDDDAGDHELQDLEAGPLTAAAPPSIPRPSPGGLTQRTASGDLSNRPIGTMV